MPTGVYTRKKGVTYKKRPAPIQEWLTLYKTGLPIEEVAKVFKVSKNRIAKEFKGAGIRLGNVVNTVDSFWERVAIGGPTDCWEWVGGTNNKGYGMFSIDNKPYVSHRYSYQLIYGDPGGLFVCHKCDNPKCVNPEHLFAGTRQDNMRDMAIKGRQGGPKPSKLTAEMVNTIREAASGNVSQAELARTYSVSPRTIWDVVNRLTWKHLR